MEFDCVVLRASALRVISQLQQGSVSFRQRILHPAPQLDRREKVKILKGRADEVNNLLFDRIILQVNAKVVAGGTRTFSLHPLGRHCLRLQERIIFAQLYSGDNRKAFRESSELRAL